MRRYRIGIIGLGARAESFARQLSAGTPRAELAGLCDIDADRLQKFCEYCGIRSTPCFTKPEEFFARSDMDAVIITTPDFTHRDVALQAVAAKKHFYLEKPMATSVEACRDIVRAARTSGARSMMGFNLRAMSLYRKLKAVVGTGVLGQIVHIEGIEQLSAAHSASFMRRFHRRRSQSGGLLNHKCSHDLDIMQWLIGHQHRLRRVAAFGGTNVFRPEKAPARTCRECPPAAAGGCRYRDRAGFVFPVSAALPMHKTQQTETYGGDLCVYNDDKDIVDNMTTIFEWDSGIRGNFNLQLFQAEGLRVTKIWGENALVESRGGRITVTESASGDVQEITPRIAAGGHGGSDPLMLDLFIDALDAPEPSTRSLEEGLAAAINALKAEEAMLSGRVVEVDPGLYEV